MTPVQDHPLRYKLANELHARPFPTLDAPCTAPAWSKCDVWNMTAAKERPSLQRVPEVAVDTASALPRPSCTIPNVEAAAKKVLEASATALSESEPLLTKYDTIVGDGDCGITSKCYCY